MILGSIFQFLGDNLIQATWDTARVTQIVGLMGIIFFIVLNLGIAIIRYYMGFANEVQLEKAVTAVVIFFAVLAYKPIMYGIDGSIDLIEKSIRDPEATMAQMAINSVKMSSPDPGLLGNGPLAPPKDVVTELQTTTDFRQSSMTPDQMQKQTAQQNYVAPSTPKDTDSGFLETIAKVAMAFTHPVDLLVSLASGGIGLAISWIVIFLSNFLLLILIAVGPLAAMFQCAPWFGNGMLKHWFTAWLSIKFWGITIAIIDTLQCSYLEHFNDVTVNNTMKTIGRVALAGPSGLMMPDPVHTIISVVFLILYIMTPKITSYYINGAGGSMMSAAVAGGSTVFNAASSGAQVAGAAMTGGATAAWSAGASMFGGSVAQQTSMQNSLAHLAKSVETLNKNLSPQSSNTKTP